MMKIEKKKIGNMSDIYKNFFKIENQKGFLNKFSLSVVNNFKKTLGNSIDIEGNYARVSWKEFKKFYKIISCWKLSNNQSLIMKDIQKKQDFLQKKTKLKKKILRKY